MLNARERKAKNSILPLPISRSLPTDSASPVYPVSMTNSRVVRCGAQGLRNSRLSLANRPGPLVFPVNSDAFFPLQTTDNPGQQYPSPPSVWLLLIGIAMIPQLQPTV